MAAVPRQRPSLGQATAQTTSPHPDPSPGANRITPCPAHKAPGSHTLPGLGPVPQLPLLGTPVPAGTRPPPCPGHQLSGPSMPPSETQNNSESAFLCVPVLSLLSPSDPLEQQHPMRGEIRQNSMLRPGTRLPPRTGLEPAQEQLGHPVALAPDHQPASSAAKQIQLPGFPMHVRAVLTPCWSVKCNGAV